VDVTEPVISFRGVVKQFGGTLAVADLDFDVLPGEIHALLGANGAGKSTVIKMLAGVHKPDRGAIFFRGQELTGRAVDRLPINFIHQDLGLFDWMTVAENIAIVRGYARRAGLIDWRRLSRDALGALGLLEAEFSPDAILSSLSKTDKTIVALARALVAHSEVLVLDEPTASLPDAEVARLFTILRRLKQARITMIYVSHRLDEIFRIADRVTVLRDGKLIASNPIGRTSPAELVVQIAGRPPAEIHREVPSAEVAPLLEAADLTVGEVGPVSLQLRAGEVLGLCGLRGAAHLSVGRALCGVEPATAGVIRLDGRQVRLLTPRQGLDKGIAFVSGNREDSLSPTLTVRENLFLNPALFGRSPWQLRRPSGETRQSDAIIRKFMIKCSGSSLPVTTLSGGNQQKLALARSMSIGSRILVLEEPTQGVDVGSKAEIYAMLHAALDDNHAVVLVSSDLEEITAQCDRVLVFNRSGLAAEVQSAAISLPHLTALVGGAHETAPVT
jgi:ribose transport system ATP-binding protein